MLVGCQEAIVEEVPEVVEETDEVEAKPEVVQEVCIPNWICEDFGSCSNLEKTRLCADTNSCGVDTDKPVESESCIECGDGICSEGEDYYLCSGDCEGVRARLLNATLEELAPESFNIPKLRSSIIPDRDLNPKQLTSTKYHGKDYEGDTNIVNKREDVLSIIIVEGREYQQMEDDLKLEYTSKINSFEDVNYKIYRDDRQEPTSDSNYLNYCWDPTIDKDEKYRFAGALIDLSERDAAIFVSFHRCGNVVGVKEIMKEYFSNFK